jgi:hypothetical protein
MTSNENARLAVIGEIVARIEKRQAEEAIARENLAEDVRELHAKSDDMIRRMAAVEPVTQMVTSFHARMIGAALLLGFLGTLAGGGWMLIKDRAGAIWAAFWGA